MTYLPVLIPTVIGLLLLGVFLVRLLRSVRSLTRVSGIVTANTRSRVGLLRARLAGLQVAIERRKASR